MKYCYAFVILIVFLSSGFFSVSAQNVDFPDANLAAKIRTRLGIDPADPITETELLTLTILQAHQSSITDLTGLEHATNLTFLSLSSNNISDISALSGLTKLTRLELHNASATTGNNNISDLSALSELTELTWLSFYRNNVSDISVLSGLTKLQSLFFYRNNVSDISALSGLTELMYLDFHRNNVSDISALSGLTKLKELSADHQWLGVEDRLDKTISDISALSNLTSLTKLWLYGNAINDISALSNLTNLTILSLNYNYFITDISALSGLTQLTGLIMHCNMISDISPLSSLTSLTTLEVSGNFISDVSPLSELTALTRLFLHGNLITDISSLSGLTNLTTLSIDDGIDASALETQVPGLTIQRPSTGGVRSCARPAPDLPTPRSLSGGSGLSYPGQVSFSELMFTAMDGLDPLPQWIELYNASETESVDLRRWRLEIESRDADGEHQWARIAFKELVIPPGQVALIVTGAAPNTVDLPEDRIYEIFKHHAAAFRQNREGQWDTVLGQHGFFLALSDPGGTVSDTIGNLDGDRLTKDEPAWELPPGRTTDGARTSLFRRYDTQTCLPLVEWTSENWVRAADVRLEVLTYWGEYTDLGNPGRKGGWRFPLERVNFSEIMFTSRGGLHSLPQWIELYNTSETQTVDLHGWHLQIEGCDDSGKHWHAVTVLESFLIPPRETVLIVTHNSRNSGDIPSSRVYNFYILHRDVFKQSHHQHRNKVLGQRGFFLKLSDPNGVVMDIAGNLDGKQMTTDRPKWELPSGITSDGARTSLMRQQSRAAGIPVDGKTSGGWVSASEIGLKFTTYWGKSTDVGTPGYAAEDTPPVGQVSFSELMFTSRGGLHSLPQWIELYNTSATQTVDLRGWHLQVEVREDSGKHRHAVIALESFLIPPRQTALIVTYTGRTAGDIPKGRIYDFFLRHHRQFEQDRHRNMVLGQRGFFLALSDAEGLVSDSIGNLDGDRLTKDEPVWEIPSGTTPSGARTSLMRHYDEIGVPLAGRASASWGRASEMELDLVTYWGKATDVGNPGYPNEAARLPGKQVSFSEFMFAASERRHRHLPLWVELYNASETQPANLRGWHLEIEVRDNKGDHQHAMLTFKDIIVLPRQTVLVVSGSGATSGDIPRARLYDISSQHPGLLRESQSMMLNWTGFSLKLSDSAGVVSDVAGNLDGDVQTADAPVWELPDVKTAEGARISLMRRYYHVTGIPLDGKASANWVPASNVPLKAMTYWGKSTDISNPGYRGGGPVPVQLSHFRPKRTDTGHVVIKWRTESETDNAGFNILRGQQRRGSFVRLNPKLVLGGGTTSESSTYAWTDTTADPRVVYYYRLEDVSFSGERRELGTVRLRGHVSAGGKRMTRWGNLKQEE